MGWVRGLAVAVITAAIGLGLMWAARAYEPDQVAWTLVGPYKIGDKIDYTPYNEELFLDKASCMAQMETDEELEGVFAEWRAAMSAQHRGIQFAPPTCIQVILTTPGKPL